MEEQPSPDRGYRVPANLSDPGPPLRWQSYLGMLIASLVPFAALIALIASLAYASQSPYPLHEMIERSIFFACLFVTYVPHLFVAPVTFMAVLRNTQGWLRPSPLSLARANRWRRRFWKAWLIGVVASVVFFGLALLWIDLSCFRCAIN
jgi:hypothetical protein